MIIGGRAKLLLDNDFTILDGDEGFYALSGYSKEEFISVCGNKCKNNMQGMDHADLIALLKHRKDLHDIEFRIQTKQHTVRWIHCVFDIVEYQNDIPVMDGLFYDVTMYKTEQYEKSIIYDNIPGAVVKYLMDENISILDANAKFYELIGTTPEDYATGSISRFTELQRKMVHDIVRAKAPKKEDIVLEYKTTNKITGQDIWIHWVGKYIGTKNGYPVYLAVLIDISYQKQLEKELEQAKSLNSYTGDLIELANKDSLTGLDNRSTFRSKVETYRHGTDCHGSFALLILDLDGFKKVNDTCGHLFGDSTLCRVSSILKDFASENTLFGRFGGDEFLIFVKNATRQKLDQLTAQINARIAGLNVLETGHISGSFGCILTSDIVSNYDVLFKTADDALYEMKKSGKNGCRIKTRLSV